MNANVIGNTAMTPAYRLSTLLLAAAASICSAAPPSLILGSYERSSRVCGDPGSADGPVSCNLAFEDRLEIKHETIESLSPTASTSSTTSVSFAFHYDYMDACLFNGTGVWSKQRLVLTPVGAPLPSACRLSLTFANGVARVSDSGGKCQPLLCGGSSRRLDGLSYRKVKAVGADPCLNSITTADMAQCSIVTSERAEKELNKTYRMVMRGLSNLEKAKLVTAQREWIHSRDESCCWRSRPAPFPSRKRGKD